MPTAFISRVLKEQAHLSLEQAYKANQFFNHDEPASNFFLNMVQKEKSGSVELKAFFQKAMKEILEKRKFISERINKTQNLTKAMRNRYYSGWLYAAIHIYRFA